MNVKKPNATEGYAQLVSYIFNTSAVGGVWTNGDGISVYKKKTGTEVGLDEVLSLPRYGDNWNEEEGIPRKQDLPRPHNVRFYYLCIPHHLIMQSFFIETGRETGLFVVAWG